MTSKTLPVVEEQVEVGTRSRETGRVRVDMVTKEEQVPVDVELRAESVEVRRVPVDRVVAAPVPDRREGDTLIISVVEEDVVVEKRLRVVEEIHIRRVGSRRHFRRMVSRRRQHAEILREKA
jgi:stress response protein YsnF